MVTDERREKIGDRTRRALPVSSSRGAVSAKMLVAARLAPRRRRIKMSIGVRSYALLHTTRSMPRSISDISGCTLT